MIVPDVTGGTTKKALVEYINGKTGKECKTWFKVNFMDIRDNPFGQVTSKAS